MTKLNQKSSLDVKEAITNSEAFFIKRKKQIIIAITAIVVIVGGYFAYNRFYATPREEKAQSQLNRGMEMMLLAISSAQQADYQAAQYANMPDSILEQTLIDQGYINTTNPDSIKLAIKDFRNNMRKPVVEAFNKVLKGDGKFPGVLKIKEEGGNAGNIATYIAGVCYFQLEQYKEAIKHLEDFNPKSDKSISPIALYTLGNCYAADNQIEKAINSFEKAAKIADNESLSPLFLCEAAKLLESQNKKKEANEIYSNIKKEYPMYGLNQQGMMSSDIDRLIERTK